MNYDESVFKEKANRRARKIWLIFAILLSANYGSDVATESMLFLTTLPFWFFAGSRFSLVKSHFG